MIESKLIKLYRGSVNNSVHTILTASALRALEELRECRRNGSLNEETESALYRDVHRGTFSFVRAADLHSFSHRGVTGSLEALDQLIKMFGVLVIDLHASSDHNYVPFSNALSADTKFIHPATALFMALGVLSLT